MEDVLRHEEHGLLADFFDVEGLTRQALAVLSSPQEYRPLGEAGARLVREEYSEEVCLPRLAELYDRVSRGG